MNFIELGVSPICEKPSAPLWIVIRKKKQISFDRCQDWHLSKMTVDFTHSLDYDEAFTKITDKSCH